MMMIIVMVRKIENDLSSWVPAFLSRTAFELWIKIRLSDPKFILLYLSVEHIYVHSKYLLELNWGSLSYKI